MKALVQRVSEGGVTIPEEKYAADIGSGAVILLGIKIGDTEEEAKFLADKCCALRIFDDSEGKMNISIKDNGGEVLVISQFTLYGDASKGNRPSYTDAARPEIAEGIYNYFVNRLKENLGDSKIKTGIFGAMMSVKIVNDGPVTIMLESKETNK